jgi:hypothetical protein
MDELNGSSVRRIFMVKKRKRKGDTMGHFLKCLSCKTMNIPQTAMNPSEKPHFKTCPVCLAQAIVEQCPEDKICTCAEGVHSGVVFCKECGNAVCPGCGSHDVAAISRITGYLQDVGGWNAGKAQELKDRKHYDAVPAR